MPLRLPTPPQQGEGIILEALASAVNQPTEIAAMVADAGPENLTTSAPHQVYFVGLRDLAQGRLLSAAQLKGWRYMLLKDEQPLASAELTGGGEALDFSNFNRGPFVLSTMEGVGRAERLDPVLAEDFELRLLDVPGLYVVALWLHGPRELIIPLPPTREELQPYAVYDEETFINLLQPPAERRLQFDNRPPAPGRA